MSSPAMFGQSRSLPHRSATRLRRTLACSQPFAGSGGATKRHRSPAGRDGGVTGASRGPASELRRQVELDDFVRVGRATDRISRQPAQTNRGIFAKAKRTAEDEPLGVGATQLEVAVGERIEQRIAFHVLVADRRVPVPTRLDLGMTDQKIGVPTGVATIKARAIGAHVVDGTTGYQVDRKSTRLNSSH